MSAGQYGRLARRSRRWRASYRSVVGEGRAECWPQLHESLMCPTFHERQFHLRKAQQMSVKSKAMRTLAVVTAAGALTVGGATAAFATDGSGPGAPDSGATATAPHRLL